MSHEDMTEMCNMDATPEATCSHPTAERTEIKRGPSMKNIGKTVKDSVANFFGVGADCPEDQEKWKQRSRNLASRRSIGGGVKHVLGRSGTVDSVFTDGGMGTPAPDTISGIYTSVDRPTHPLSAMASPIDAPGAAGHKTVRPCPTPVDPLHRPPSRQFSYSRTPVPHQMSHQLSRQISTASTSRRSSRMYPSRRAHKESVAKMAIDGVRTLASPVHRTKRKPYLRSRSFAPTSISSFHDLDLAKNNEILEEIVKESHLRENELKSPMWETMDDSVLDDVFFALPDTMASPHVQPYAGTVPPLLHLKRGPDGTAAWQSLSTDSDLAAQQNLPILWEQGTAPRVPQNTPRTPSKFITDDMDLKDGERASEKQPLTSKRRMLKRQPAVRLDSEEDPPEMSVPSFPRPIKHGWSIKRHIALLPEVSMPDVPGTPDVIGPGMPSTPDVSSRHLRMQRVAEKIFQQLPENSNRREIGKGVVGQLFRRTYRKDRINSAIKAQLDDIDDHRPYFTYWVTFVQVLIYVIAVAAYGIAPIGFEETMVKAEVIMPSLAIEKKSYFIEDNFWIGPRQADLIHMGAKYSPCMRQDANIIEALEGDRLKESTTACCIRNDGSGCIQTTKDKCSLTLATWFTWKFFEWDPTNKELRRKSGSVCGLDPRTCQSPASAGSYTWKDDITTWPICNSGNDASYTPLYKHLSCEVVGRPCCVGIHGECIITTREYCNFHRGYFHEEAFLCTQVSCLTEICGMISFLQKDKPDQFYRFWTSLFLHAGLLQLIVTVLFQFFIMRDLEKLAGWLRIAIIYLGSGIAGSLSSAIFLPYHVEAGPAGSQFGLIACLIVEVIQNWYILENPFASVLKLSIIVIVLFTIGLLPMVDNYAHLFGFIFGFMMSFALLPYVTFGTFDRRRKLMGIIICLVTSMGCLAVLISLFYVIGVYDCPYCHYFNCIPFTPKFCASMEVKINRTKQY